MSYRNHPITGEPISLGESASWLIQKSIRRWSFLVGITIITVACVIWGTYNIGVIAWWNVWASYMALFIESVVGISMFKQTQADAEVIRKILAMEMAQFAELRSLIEEVKEMLEQSSRVAERIETDLEILEHDVMHVEHDPKIHERRSEN